MRSLMILINFLKKLKYEDKKKKILMSTRPSSNWIRLNEVKISRKHLILLTEHKSLDIN